MRTVKYQWSLLLPALVAVFCVAGRPAGMTPGGGGQTIAGTDSVIDDIRDIELQYKQAFISGDSALFLKCYAPEACVLAPNTPTLCGQRGLGQFYKGARQAGIRDAVFTSLGLFGQTSEYVTQQGSVELFDAGQHPVGKAKVLIVWRNTAGG